MVESYTGEIRMMANANGTYPIDWALCDGSTLSVQNYQALFSLIGTTYGGDGVNTFALPDLRGRLPIGEGAGTNLTARTIGQKVGTETVALQPSNIPPHAHALNTAGGAATTVTAGPTVTFANTASPTTQYLKDGLGTAGGTAVNPAPTTVGNTGNGAVHDNIMLCATVNFIICLNGIYPQADSH